MKLLRNLFVLACFFPSLSWALYCGTGAILPADPTAYYLDNEDGTITDTRTLTMWKKCSEGQSWNGSSCTGTALQKRWDTATVDAGNAIFNGKDDWRLPTLEEMKQFVLDWCYIHPMFPNTPESSFWTSREYFSFQAFYGHLGNGYPSTNTSWQYKAFSSYYRLARTANANELPTATPNTASDCLFNWAEQQYASFLSPAGATSATTGNYYYRHYTGTNSYLATSNTDNHLYYLGPATGNVVTDLGAVSTWLTQAGCQ